MAFPDREELFLVMSTQALSVEILSLTFFQGKFSHKTLLEVTCVLITKNSSSLSGKAIVSKADYTGSVEMFME